MREKLFSFRWDIDHRACMTDGVPVIREVCREFGVANTFFVNMGRSTNLREWLGKGLRGSRQKLNDTESINLIQKIGWRRFATETILARPVGRSFIGPLQELQRDGHELGLHGGTDHVIWSRRFPELPEAEIERDVEETLREFESHFGRPSGFTSPGFRSDVRIMRLVERLAFRYHGDAIGGTPRLSQVDDRIYNHWTIPVTICGPRTVPFFEWHAARGTPEDEALADFEKELTSNDISVLYGHPCQEGLDRRLLQRIFEIVAENGFRVVTHETLLTALDHASSGAAA